jgi:hypothetical protein
MEKTKTVHERMAIIKDELSKSDIPKSGHNTFAGFRYHELQDFMPFINKLNAEHGINTVPKFLKKEGICIIKIFNVEDASDNYEVVIPYVDAEMLARGGGPSKVDAVQRLGSTITYNRRYLYMAAYDITESDSVDARDNTPVKAPAKKAPRKPIKKDVLNSSHKVWKNVVVGLKSGYTIEQVKAKYEVSKEVEEELLKLKDE